MKFAAVAAFAVVAIFCRLVCCAEASSDDVTEKLPTVLIVTLFRNKEPVLPYYFSFLSALDYPKDRIALWFRSDHNEDQTDAVLSAWHRNASAEYHSVLLQQTDNATTASASEKKNDTDNNRRPSEADAFDWPYARHQAIIDMKQEALAYAKRSWADFVFFLDADVLLTDPHTLSYLTSLRQPLIAPMLLSDGLYSNFWAGMSASYYYKREPEYKHIYHHSKLGEFPVPMIHSAVLIHLRDPRTDVLTFDRYLLGDIGEDERAAIPQDDIIVLAVSANRSALPMLVSNQRRFGYVMVPLSSGDHLEQDRRQLTNVKVMAINELGHGIQVLPALQPFVRLPQRDSVGLDNIVMINLKRRPERREWMERNFEELGLEVQVLPAVDGKLLTAERLVELGVEVMPAYADPYHKRPMTMGEIGCFLSHFWVWEEMAKRGNSQVLVLEDDIRFETYFKERLEELLQEARALGGWDLIYLGRKRLQNEEERAVEGSSLLVRPSYSYWTLGYVITLQGVQKLLAAKPLTKMLPIDEFLPIMFDQHVNDTWKSHFAERNLVAWSAAPLLIYPTHYVGDEGYLSDTEDSAWLQQQRDDGIEEELDAENKGKRESVELNEVEVDEEEEKTSVDDSLAIDEEIDVAEIVSAGEIDVADIVEEIEVAEIDVPEIVFLPSTSGKSEL